MEKQSQNRSNLKPSMIKMEQKLEMNYKENSKNQKNADRDLKNGILRDKMITAFQIIGLQTYLI